MVSLYNMQCKSNTKRTSVLFVTWLVNNKRCSWFIRRSGGKEHVKKGDFMNMNSTVCYMVLKLILNETHTCFCLLTPPFLSDRDSDGYKDSNSWAWLDFVPCQWSKNNMQKCTVCVCVLPWGKHYDYTLKHSIKKVCQNRNYSCKVTPINCYWWSTCSCRSPMNWTE